MKKVKQSILVVTIFFYHCRGKTQKKQPKDQGTNLGNAIPITPSLS